MPISKLQEHLVAFRVVEHGRVVVRDIRNTRIVWHPVASDATFYLLQYISTFSDTRCRFNDGLRDFGLLFERELNMHAVCSFAMWEFRRVGQQKHSFHSGEG